MSKRNHENYLMIDHRNTEPVSDEQMLRSGMPKGSGKGLFETSTYTCSHCQAQVILNPNRRVDNPRAWCKKCDHYICDGCGAEMHLTGECVPFEKKIEMTLEAAVRQQAAEPEEAKSPILLLS